jgi:hypothetical protein
MLPFGVIIPITVPQRSEILGVLMNYSYMYFETTRSSGTPRNRWQDEVREDGRTVGGEEWQEKVYDREEPEKLLRTARNRRILHMPKE